MENKIWVINGRGRPQYFELKVANQLIAQGTHQKFDGIPTREYYPEYDNSMSSRNAPKLVSDREGDKLDVELIP